MRKPDGYVPLLEDGSINFDQDSAGLRIIPVYCEPYVISKEKPVCLVPPELLDWVEKVRGVFKDCKVDESVSPDYGALLFQLNSILPPEGDPDSSKTRPEEHE